MDEELSPVIVVDKRHAKYTKTMLEQLGCYNKKYKMKDVAPGRIALPIFDLNFDVNAKIEGVQLCLESAMSLPLSNRETKNAFSPRKLQETLIIFLREKGIDIPNSALGGIPKHWDLYARDMVVLPQNAFSSQFWKNIANEVSLWWFIAAFFSVKRVSRKGVIQNDHFRSSNIELLYGQDGLVTVVNNGIKYSFDATKTMFSSGNITEKLRVAQLDCEGETVLDLYAGIGYFVLPFLLHGHAKIVYACEWNPAAIKSLERNLKLNHVEDKCIVLFGDNKKVAPVGIADRVNVGLIPSSRDGWPVACAALNQQIGGWLHIHGNVETLYQPHENHALTTDKSEYQLRTDISSNIQHLSDDQSYGKVGTDNRNRRRECWHQWAQNVSMEIKTLLESKCSASWIVTIRHIEHVKSYAPFIDHLVIDLECRPTYDR